MRLIDAEALKAAMYHEAMEKDSKDQRWDSGCWIRYRMFERVVDSMPSVERKKGRWLDSFGLVQCSECRIEYFYKYKFCPNCGADLREDVKTNGK